MVFISELKRKCKKRPSHAYENICIQNGTTEIESLIFHQLLLHSGNNISFMIAIYSFFIFYICDTFGFGQYNFRADINIQ